MPSSVGSQHRMNAGKEVITHRRMRTRMYGGEFSVIESSYFDYVNLLRSFALKL